MKANSKSVIATLWLVLALIGLSSSSLLADLVIETRSGGQNTGWYAETGGAWGNSSVSTSVSPATGGIGSRYTTSTDLAFVLTPTLESGHTYSLAHALPVGATSSSQNLVLGITATDCTGLPTTTDVWQYHGTPTSLWLNCWRTVGTLTASTANPTITFAFSSGSASRCTAAAFFLKDLACLTPAVGGISGPLIAGQTVVNVYGVDPTATAVYVYTNNDGTHATCIGTNSAPGGNTTVPVTVFPLVRGRQLQGNQKTTCEPNPPPGTSGPIVGAGTNGGVTVCFDLIQTATPNDFVWLGASGGQPGYLNPPIGATVFNPSVGWQKLALTPGTSPAWRWNNTPEDYTGLLATSGTATNIAIWFTETDASETGPYTVYIDNFKNGDTLLKGWEGDAVGASTFMQVPSWQTGSGTTTVNNAPNTTLCVDTNAAVGTQCQRMDWQWAKTGPNSVRGMCIAPLSVWDLSKPLSVDVLVLPAGATKPVLQVSQPADKALYYSTPGSVTITATDNSALYGGTAALTYQWKHNGVNIDSGNAGDRTGYNTATLSFTAPVDADAGNYSCYVTSTVTGGTYPGTYNLECNQFAVSVGPLPVTAVTIDSISGTTIKYSGGQGSQFILLESATANASMSTWTQVGTANTTTPGEFTIPAVGTQAPKFYRIESR